MSQLKELEIALSIIKETNNIVKEENLDDEQIAFFRDDIRKKAFFLQEEMQEQHSDTVSKFAMFPLLAYVDEKIMFEDEKQSTSFNWTLLQQEYYGRKDGGEYVFDIIDNLLSNEIYPPICYRIIYFVLQDGFLGQYYNNRFDKEFLSYRKRISLIVERKDYDTSNFQDASTVLRPMKASSFFKKSIVMLSIPTVIFGISLLYLFY